MKTILFTLIFIISTNIFAYGNHREAGYELKGYVRENYGSWMKLITSLSSSEEEGIQTYKRLADHNVIPFDYRDQRDYADERQRLWDENRKEDFEREHAQWEEVKDNPITDCSSGNSGVVGAAVGLYVYGPVGAIFGAVATSSEGSCKTRYPEEPKFDDGRPIWYDLGAVSDMGYFTVLSESDLIKIEVDGEIIEVISIEGKYYGASSKTFFNFTDYPIYVRNYGNHLPIISTQPVYLSGPTGAFSEIIASEIIENTEIKIVPKPRFRDTVGAKVKSWLNVDKLF